MYKAVIVGINEYPKYPLAGCVNDANDVVKYLTESRDYAYSDIKLLLDEDATRKRIAAALRDMIRGSSAGDSLLFHYSGHGTQLPTHDVDEPDGLDESLCPVDFDFDDLATALTDNDMHKIFVELPEDVVLTVVLDSCHSGDSAKVMKRGEKRDLAKKPASRFMPPPKYLADKISGKKRVLRKRGASNELFVSACRPDEEASDTTFDGRPNGAFTYSWLRRLDERPNDPVSALVAATADDLEKDYRMHPQIDGAPALREQSFLQATRSIVIAPASRAPGQVVFDQGWSSNLMGLMVGAEVRIALRDGGFDCHVIGNIGGGNALVLPLRLDGNMRQAIDLTFGFKLIFAVSGWSASGTSVSFDLSVQVAPPSLPFLTVPPVTLVQQRITLPVTGFERSRSVPTSAAEFLALIQLSQMGVTLPPPGEAPIKKRDFNEGENIIQLREGTEGWGPNWREDRLIRIGFLPQGQKRRHVTLGPQQGQGNVYVVGWGSDDETNGDFILHMGNNFFGGWGSTRWVLHGVYAESHPFPKSRDLEATDARQPAPQKNGSKARAMADDLTMDDPEAGGSIRA